MSLVRRYIALFNRREGGESIALVRIAIALVILWDLGEVLRFGLVEALWAASEQGGIGRAMASDPVARLYELLGASRESTWLLFSLVSTAALGLALGVCSRTSALILLFAYAELARLSPDADRGIDTLLRNVLFVLAFARSDATFSLTARLRGGRFATRSEVLAWPRYAIIAQLTLLYFAAGMLKQSASWSARGDYSSLFLVLHNPHMIRYDWSHGLLVAGYPLLQAATVATLVWERSALLLPLLVWARGTAERGGRIRWLLNRARLLEIWVITGVVFHLSLAVLLALGIFPWGCLALYPALARPNSWSRWISRISTFASTRGGTSFRAP